MSLLLAGCMAMTALTGCATSIDTRKTDDSSTLYVGHVGNSFPTSFMPWLSRDGIAPTVASMLYNTLFSYDEDAKRDLLMKIYDSLKAIDSRYNPVVTLDHQM